MTQDPTAYILFAALLGGAIGFFGSALLTSGSIRKAQRDAYWDGFAACNREHAKHDPRSVPAQADVELRADGSASYTPPKLRKA